MTGYVHGATRQPTPLDRLQSQVAALARAHNDLAGKYEIIAAENRKLTKQVAALERTPPAFIAAPVKVRPLGEGVPTTRALAHISHLRQNGVQCKDIAAASGASKQLISRINTGNVTKISPLTEALILAVEINKETS